MENKLTFEKLSAWTKPDYLKTTKVLVFLPKFKLEDYYDMESIFQDLGVGDIFQGGKADLSEMSPERGLCVSKFIHEHPKSLLSRESGFRPWRVLPDDATSGPPLGERAK